jgi:hypothetical protein
MNTKIIVASAILGMAAIGALVYAGNEQNENKQKVALTEMPSAAQKPSKTILVEERSSKQLRKPKGERPITKLKSRSLAGKRLRSRSSRTATSSASGRKRTTMTNVNTRFDKPETRLGANTSMPLKAQL